MAKTIKEMAEAHAPINRDDAWEKTQKQKWLEKEWNR